MPRNPHLSPGDPEGGAGVRQLLEHPQHRERGLAHQNFLRRAFSYGSVAQGTWTRLAEGPTTQLAEGPGIEMLTAWDLDKTWTKMGNQKVEFRFED